MKIGLGGRIAFESSMWRITFAGPVLTNLVHVEKYVPVVLVKPQWNSGTISKEMCIL